MCKRSADGRKLAKACLAEVTKGLKGRDWLGKSPFRNESGSHASAQHTANGPVFIDRSARVNNFETHDPGI